jgi:signal peptidase II
MADDAEIREPVCLKTRLTWLLTLAPALFAADYITKRIVLENMTPYGPTIELIDGLARLRFIYNDGIVFGISPSFLTGTTLAVFSVFVALLMTAYLLFARLDDRLTLIALCMVVGGAAGNLLDRVLWGRVIDFIEVGFGDLTWPVFNVADMSVSVGAVLLAWRLLVNPPPEKQPPAGETDSGTIDS